MTSFKYGNTIIIITPPPRGCFDAYSSRRKNTLIRIPNAHTQNLTETMVLKLIFYGSNTCKVLGKCIIHRTATIGNEHVCLAGFCVLDLVSFENPSSLKRKSV